MKRFLKFVVVGILGISLVGCTRTDTTKRLLEDQGFTNVETTGWRPFACGEDYTFHTGFKANAPNTHRPVKGVVCSGFLKGSSIKFD